MAYSELDALGDMSEFPDLADPAATSPVVRCQVCAVDLDKETGAPLGPVGEENVRAVEEYVLGGGQAELGGQALVDPMGGPDPGGMGGLDPSALAGLEQLGGLGGF